METRKTKKADLSQKRNVYFNLGLVLAMVFVISAFEWKSYGEIEFADITIDKGNLEILPEIPITRREPPKPPPLKIPKTIVEVEDDTPDLPQVAVSFDDLLPITYPEIEVEPEKVDDTPFTIVEKMPEPEGGYLKLMKYLSKKIKYPRQAENMGIEGKVFVEFIIDETGKLTEVHTIKGIGAGCDEEAEHVLRNAPKWNPGKQRGVPVKVKMVLPIHFQLGK